MIYTKKKNLSRYLGQSKSLDAAIRAILRNDQEQLSMGRNDIDGDNAFVNRFDYDTMPQEQALWEGHIAYGDVHVLLGGHEKIGVSNVEHLTETVRKEQEDFVGFQGPVETWFTMTPEDVLIVYPEDIHMVKVADGDTAHVRKCCYKFKVEIL